MNLKDLKIHEYLDVLRSDSPAPGGGSASALAGAQGMSLLVMVLGLTIGKEKYAEFQATLENAADKARKGLLKLMQSIDSDTDAFNLVANAYKMPKETDEEKARRSESIQAGTITATEVPLFVMNLANDGLAIIESVLGKTNPSAFSDLGVAVLNLRVCAQGAWLNVRINLPGIKDVEKAEAYRKEAQEIMENIEKISTKLYNKISEEI